MIQSGGAHFPYPKEVWSPSGSFLVLPLPLLRYSILTCHLSAITVMLPFQPLPSHSESFQIHPFLYCTPLSIGGWWSRPENWKANTTVVALGIAGTTYGIWLYSADNEVSFVDSLSSPVPIPLARFMSCAADGSAQGYREKGGMRRCRRRAQRDGELDYVLNAMLTSLPLAVLVFPCSGDTLHQLKRFRR